MQADELIEFDKLFNVVRARKKRILKSIIFFFIVIMSCTFFSKPVWEANSVLLFPTSKQLVSSLLPSTAAEVMGVHQTGVKPFIEILESDKVLSLVSKKCHIDKIKLKKKIKIREKSTSSILISAEDPSKLTAKKICNAHIEALESSNLEIFIPSVRSTLKSTELEIERNEKILSRYEEELRKCLANSKGIQAISGPGIQIAAPSQVVLKVNQISLDLKNVNAKIKNIVSKVGDFKDKRLDLPSYLPPVKVWRDKLIKIQHSLNVARITFGENSPQIIKLQEEEKLLKEKLKKEIEDYFHSSQIGMTDELNQLIVQKTGLEAESEAALNIMRHAPLESVKYQEIAREVLTYSTIIMELKKKHQFLKLSEIEDPNKWCVLDNGVIQDKPTNKNYLINGLFSIILGAFVGAFISTKRVNT